MIIIIINTGGNTDFTDIVLRNFSNWNNKYKKKIISIITSIFYYLKLLKMCKL